MQRPVKPSSSDTGGSNPSGRTVFLVRDVLWSLRRIATRFDSGQEHHVAGLSGEGAWLQPRLIFGSTPGRDSLPAPADPVPGFLNLACLVRLQARAPACSPLLSLVEYVTSVALASSQGTRYALPGQHCHRRIAPASALLVRVPAVLRACVPEVRVQVPPAPPARGRSLTGRAPLLSNRPQFNGITRKLRSVRSLNERDEGSTPSGVSFAVV